MQENKPKTSFDPLCRKCRQRMQEEAWDQGQFLTNRFIRESTPQEVEEIMSLLGFARENDNRALRITTPYGASGSERPLAIESIEQARSQIG